MWPASLVCEGRLPVGLRVWFGLLIHPGPDPSYLTAYALARFPQAAPVSQENIRKRTTPGQAHHSSHRAVNGYIIPGRVKPATAGLQGGGRAQTRSTQMPASIQSLSQVENKNPRNPASKMHVSPRKIQKTHLPIRKAPCAPDTRFPPRDPNISPLPRFLCPAPCPLPSLLFPCTCLFCGE